MYAIEYRFDRICKSLFSVSVSILHNVPTEGWGCTVTKCLIGALCIVGCINLIPHFKESYQEHDVVRGPGHQRASSADLQEPGAEGPAGGDRGERKSIF